MTTSKGKAIKLVMINWIIAFFLGITACVMLWSKVADFHETVRGYLFSGFLTLGSFLLTTKTFVITRLQDGLFHTIEYDKKYKEAVRQNGKEKTGERNEGLRRLTEFLVWSVFSCMAVSVGQLLLSACRSNLASAIALAACCASLFLVLRSWIYIRSFIHEYLEFANDRPLPEEDN